VFLDTEELKVLTRELDRARTDGAHFCPVPRKDALGALESWHKIRRRNPTGGGIVTRVEPVLYGSHDADFLEVDAESGHVRCGACESGRDATAPARDGALDEATRRELEPDSLK